MSEWANIQPYDYQDLDDLRGTLRVTEDEDHLAVVFEESTTGTLYLLELYTREVDDDATE